MTSPTSPNVRGPLSENDLKEFNRGNRWWSNYGDLSLALNAYLVAALKERSELFEQLEKVREALGCMHQCSDCYNKSRSALNILDSILGVKP